MLQRVSNSAEPTVGCHHPGVVGALYSVRMDDDEWGRSHDSHCCVALSNLGVGAVLDEKKHQTTQIIPEQLSQES